MTSDIHRIRRFNRAVTRETGALDTSFLGRGRPLGAARVLNAIGKGQDDIGHIRKYLGLDSGLMSRLLRSLETEGLITTLPHPKDGRRRIAQLTQSGETEFSAYEELSNAQAQKLLDAHPKPNALLAAMDLVASALGQDDITIERADPTSATAQSCLSQYYDELAQRFERGFDVNLSCDPDAGDMCPPRGDFIIANSDGQAIGCAGLKGSGGTTAEVKRLWVSPAARGLKLATRLMAEIEARALNFGIDTLRLDTNSALPEAVALYRNAGWTEIPRFNDDPYPDVFFEKRL